MYFVPLFLYICVMEELLLLIENLSKGLKNIFSVFDSPAVEAMIERLNREQLLSGKKADGSDLMRYVDDPYFKTMEAALKYKEWKKEISPNKLKDSDIMDFYINGQFHNTIYAEANKKSITIGANSHIERSFEMKTDGQGFGLNDTSRVELFNYVKPLMIQALWK